MKYLVLFVLLLAACTPAATPTAAPSATAIPELTKTPTVAPSNTATASATPLPTATFTPDVTPTQLPVLTPPSKGVANVAGLVLWNHQPVAHGAVWLCKGWTFYGGCLDYKTNTDSNGYYVFHNVIPGSYLVAMNSFGSSWYIFYFDAKGNDKQAVVADQTLIFDPWSIWKLDLNVVYPADGKAISDPLPTLKWDPYPDAAYYQVTLDDEKGKSIAKNARVTGTAYTPATPLVNCHYKWFVDAFTADGVLIAVSASRFATGPELSFNLFGLKDSCQ